MTAPTAPPLFTLEQFEALVAGTGIEQLRLDAIIAEIRDYCGWHIAPAIDATLTIDGSGAAVQQLPTLQLNSVSSVAENGVVLPSTEYEWSADGSLRRCSYIRWTRRYRGVVAEVNHGYAEVPPNILSVVLDATSTAISTPVGTDAELPETMGPFAFGGGKGVVLTAAMRRVLDHYVIPGKP